MSSYHFTPTAVGDEPPATDAQDAPKPAPAKPAPQKKPIMLKPLVLRARPPAPPVVDIPRLTTFAGGGPAPMVTPPATGGLPWVWIAGGALGLLVLILYLRRKREAAQREAS